MNLGIAVALVVTIIIGLLIWLVADREENV